ncbi:MAG: hypothetical protein JEY94_19015 [Melioribacteraceae bacterium]|nr:hypothetical protein [Melioribacteraceae bacterium]
MKRILISLILITITLSAQEVDTSKTEKKSSPEFSISELQYFYNADVNYDWTNTYLSSHPFSFNSADLTPLFPTGKEMLSPLRIKYKNQEKYKMLYQVLGTIGTAAAVGAATYHVIKYKDEYKKDFK